MTKYSAMARTNSSITPTKTSPSDLHVTPERDDNAGLGVITQSIPPCTLDSLSVLPSIKEVTKSRANKKKRPNSPAPDNTSVRRKRIRRRVSPKPKQQIGAELDTPKLDSEATKVNFAKHKTMILSEKRITRSTRSSYNAVTEAVKPLLDKEIKPIALTQKAITPVKSTVVRKRKKILIQNSPPQIKINKKRQSTAADVTLEKVSFPTEDTALNEGGQGSNLPKLKKATKRKAQSKLLVHPPEIFSSDILHDLAGEKNGPKNKKKPSSKRKPSKILKRKEPPCRPFDQSVLPSTSSAHLSEEQGLAETVVDNSVNINVVSANNYPRASLIKPACVQAAIPVSCTTNTKQRKTNTKKAQTQRKSNKTDTKKKSTLVKTKWQKPNPPTIISLKLKPFTDWSTAVCEKSAGKSNDQDANHLLSSKCGNDKKLYTLKKTKKPQTKSKLRSKFPQLKTKKSIAKEQKLFNSPILNNVIPENPKHGLVSLHRATEESSDTSLVTVSTRVEIRPESTSHSWANISTSTTSTSRLIPICGKIPTLRIIRLNSTNHRSLRKSTTLTDTTVSSSDRGSSNRENLEKSCKSWQDDNGQTSSKESFCNLVKNNDVDLSLSSDNTEYNAVNRAAYISDLQKIRQSDESLNFFKDLKLIDHYAKMGKERKLKEKDSINLNIPKPTLNKVPFTQPNKIIFRSADSSQSNRLNSFSYAINHPPTTKDAEILFQPLRTPQPEQITNESHTEDTENLLPHSNTRQAEPTTSKDAENLLPPSSTTQTEPFTSKDVENFLSEPSTSMEAENFLVPSGTPQAEPITRDAENLLQSSCIPQAILKTSTDAENILTPSNTLTAGKGRTLSDASNHLGDDTLSIYTNIFSEESICSENSAENSSDDYNQKRSKKNTKRQKFVCEKQNADSTSLAYAQPPSINKTINSNLPSVLKPGLIVAPNNKSVDKEQGARSVLFHRICKANLDKSCPHEKKDCPYYHIPNHKHYDRVTEELSKASIQQIINEYVIMRELLFRKNRVFYNYANLFLTSCLQRLYGPLITEIMLDLYNNDTFHSTLNCNVRMAYLERGLNGLNACQMRKDCFTLYTCMLSNGRRFVNVLLEVIGSLENKVTSICVELLQVVKDIGEQVPLETATQLVYKCCRESDDVELIEATYQLVIRNTSNNILANVILLKKFLGVLIKNSTINEDFEEYHKQLAVSMTGYVAENVNRQSNQSISDNICVPNLCKPDVAYNVGENSAIASLVQRPPPMILHTNPPRMNLPQHNYRTSPDTTQYPDSMNNQMANSSRIPPLVTPRRSNQYQPQRMLGIRFPYQPRPRFRGRWSQAPRAQFHQSRF